MCLHWACSDARRRTDRVSETGEASVLLLLLEAAYKVALQDVQGLELAG